VLEVKLAQFVSNELGQKETINIRDVLVNEDYARLINAPLCIATLPAAEEPPTAALIQDIINASFPLEPQNAAAQFVNTSIVPVNNKEKDTPQVRIITPPRAISPALPRPLSPLQNVYGAETEMPLQILQVFN
jgi:hypothetical protein